MNNCRNSCEIEISLTSSSRLLEPMTRSPYNRTVFHTPSYCTDIDH